MNKQSLKHVIGDDHPGIGVLRTTRGRQGNHSKLSGEDLWTAQFDDDKALQAEFGSKEIYFAYMRRHAI